MKSVSSLWVGALWQAAMPAERQAQSANVSQTAAQPSAQMDPQVQQTTNPA